MRHMTIRYIKVFLDKFIVENTISFLLLKNFDHTLSKLAFKLSLRTVLTKCL